MSEKPQTFTQALRDITKGAFMWLKADAMLKGPYDLGNAVVDVAAVDRDKAEARSVLRRGSAYFYG